MDSTPACLDFAVIGHQDGWQSIAAMINGMRTNEQLELPCDTIKSIFSFIPPRDIFRVKVISKTGAEINGVYIDTFIDPDKLDMQYGRTNISKVVKAIIYAQKMGVKVVALGGFTSIVLEGNTDLWSGERTKFTTGNTLTAAFIVKAIEKATRLKNIDLHKCNVLIVGATGDIGLACVHYLKQGVKKLLLCARNHHRLKNLANQLIMEKIEVGFSVCMNDLIPDADVIICVASSCGLRIKNCKKDSLICDAGYPKNLEVQIGGEQHYNLFYGGMGQVSNGYYFNPDYSKCFYKTPAPNIAHGCMLEAMVLAFENRFENYSAGKGAITPEKIEEIYKLSLKNGIHIAPFHNGQGLW